jgi:hypothetical protein
MLEAPKIVRNSQQDPGNKNRKAQGVDGTEEPRVVEVCHLIISLSFALVYRVASNEQSPKARDPAACNKATQFAKLTLQDALFPMPPSAHRPHSTRDIPRHTFQTWLSRIVGETRPQMSQTIPPAVSKLIA